LSLEGVVGIVFNDVAIAAPGDCVGDDEADVGEVGKGPASFPLDD
jgi:hypothetical protein